MCHFLKSTIGALFPLPIISICHIILGLFFLAPFILWCQFFRPPWRVWQWKVSQCYFKLFFGVVLLIQSIICHIIWRCLVVLLCHFHGCLIVWCLNVRCLNARCLVVWCLVVLDSGWNGWWLVAVCTWKDRPTPNFELGIWGKKYGDPVYTVMWRNRNIDWQNS